MPSAEILKQREETLVVYQKTRAGWEADRAMYTPHSLVRHFLEDVHGHFRRSFQQVGEMVRSNRKEVADGTATVGLVTPDVQKAFAWRVRNLLNHHTGEDRHFFPIVVQFEPSLKNDMKRLEDDHQKLHPLEDIVLDRVRLPAGAAPITDVDRVAALEEFLSFLEDHLNREEMLLVPFMVKHKNAF
jgi:iron-sulfur cluster repair protein YtfE (RIC family)